jgi:1-acyl-sn-glycerol-3-phosphate acyltransferase
VPLLYYFLYILSTPLLFLLTRLEVKGKQNIPRNTGCIVTSNHLSLADPPLLGYCLGRKTAYFAKEELFSPRPFAWLILTLGAISVRRGKLNRDALKKSEAVLANGKRLVIFPEGGRSRGALLKTTFGGAALIAMRNRVPVLPVSVTGTEVIKGIGWLWKRPKIVVNIGVPFYPPSVDGKIEKERLSEFTDLIMKRIAELLPAEYQGEYASAGRKDEAEH